MLTYMYIKKINLHIYVHLFTNILELHDNEQTSKRKLYKEKIK